MEIKITCRSCQRTYPIEMSTDPEARPGHCPLCGEVLAFQYSATYVEVADRVKALGGEFSRQLTLLAELAGGYAIDTESVLKPLRDAMSQQDRKIAEPHRPGWPPRPSEPVR